MKTKKALVLVVRILLSVGMLALLAWQIPDFEASELVADWRASSIVWVIIAVLATVGSVVLSAVRWQQVLHGLDLPTPFRPLVTHYFAGQFVSNVLPTTIGGDVLRVARLSRTNGDRERTFASVVIERLTGWLVLPVMSVIGFSVNRGLRHLGTATTVALLVGVVTLVGLMVVLWVATHERGGGRYASHDGWRGFIGAVHLGLDHLRRHPADAVNVLLAGFAYQATVVFAAFMCARAVGIDAAGFTAMLAFIPAVLILQVLPIGISGLGVREGALVLFLSPLGVSDEKAIALGLLFYLTNLIASLAGAPAFALGGRGVHDVDHDLLEEAVELGHGDLGHELDPPVENRSSEDRADA